MDASSVSEQRRLPAKRKFFIKLMLYILSVTGVLVVALCYYVTQPVWSIRFTHNATRVNPRRLEAHVRTLSEKMVPRDASNLKNLDLVAAYIREEFERSGARTKEQSYQVGNGTYRNVIAAFGPETKEVIVVGAHYDAAGPYPGADDNASGVAGIIELAQLLRQTDLPVKVELVAYSLEEPPFFRSDYMGSAMHAQSLKKESVQVRAMIVMEMIGYFSDASGSQRFPAPGLSLLYPSQGNFICVVGRMGEAMLVRRIKRSMLKASSLPVYSINAPRSIPGIDLSDHMNYWEEGHPAVMVTDTAFYRNPNYHTAADTAEKLDYEKMALVIEGVYAAVKDLAG